MVCQLSGSSDGCTSIFIVATSINNLVYKFAPWGRTPLCIIRGMLKFACFSDTHERGPSVDIEATQCNYVLHAGDLYDRLSNGMTPTAFDNLEKWERLHKNLLIVRGNHDVLDPANVFQKCDITGIVREIRDDLFVVGIGWHGSRFYELPREEDIQKACSHLYRQACIKIPTGAHSIVLTHYPAYLPGMFKGPDQSEDLFDEYKVGQGWFFQAVSHVISAFRPLAVVQGHTHQMFGKQASINGTLIFWPGPRGGILTVDTTAATASFEGF